MVYDKEIQNVMDKYFTLKEIFIECEETDAELKTNLQPINEFRAILDHIMKLLYADKKGETDQVKDQIGKLNAHIDRCFFDVCDMLGINYRNKINDVLGMYDVDVIRTVLPNYYSETKAKIEKINKRIAKYRGKKGTPGVSQSDIRKTFADYKKDVYFLRETYDEIISSQSSLEEVKNKLGKSGRKRKVLEWITTALLGAIISGTIVGLILNKLGI